MQGVGAGLERGLRHRRGANAVPIEKHFRALRVAIHGQLRLTPSGVVVLPEHGYQHHKGQQRDN